MGIPADRLQIAGVLDTIVLEPDLERLTLTWRVTRPLKKSIFQIARVQGGIQGNERWADADAASAATTGAA